MMEMQRAMSAVGAVAVAPRACFLTDVEGNWQYVRNVVRQSRCLRFRDARERELELRDDCMLVFGGDAGDKGDDTLHCYEELVRLKKAHPERVVLLVGNRDVNKMRFTSELHDSEMDLRTMAAEIRDGPAWVPKDKRGTLTKFLTKRALAAAEAAGACPTSEAADRAMDLSSPLLQAVNTKVNRLHWMLSNTMGSHGDFERRRSELERRGDSDVTDEDVLQSFVGSVQQGGVLREFLELGCLAFIAHNTLFVHGGLINRGASADAAIVSVLGRVPGDSKAYEDVHEWTEKLNAWYQQQLQQWIEQPTWTADRSTRGGNELMEYVLPSYTRSVIMGRHLTNSGMPAALPNEVATSLHASGITRVIVGHTPHGTCPTVIRQPLSPFCEVIMCDTSYSDMAAPDNRGVAASELVLHADGRVDVSGVLENGRPIEFSTQVGTPSVIGKLLADGTRVKAKLSDKEDEYLVFKVENGYSYTYWYRSLAELHEIGFAEAD